MSVATAPAPVRHLFTVEEWDLLGRLGFFPPEARVELIEGEIFEMSPIGDRHAACVKRLNRLLCAQVGDEAIVQVQDPVRLSDLSEPEPDIALLRYREDYYDSGKPRPADVLLLIEVADSTLAFDRDRKGPLYSVSGIVEYWIVDLNSNQVLVYSEPGAHGDREPYTARTGEVLVPTELPGVSVPVSEILGVV